MTDELKIDTLEDCKEYVAKLIGERESLRNELMASLKILSAVIMTHSGTVRIPEKIMIEAHNSETYLTHSNDEKTNEAIIKVTSKAPEKKRIINLHEKSGRIIQ